MIRKKGLVKEKGQREVRTVPSETGDFSYVDLSLSSVHSLMTADRNTHTKARNSTPLLKGEAERVYQPGSSQCLENSSRSNEHQK